MKIQLNQLVDKSCLMRFAAQIRRHGQGNYVDAFVAQCIDFLRRRGAADLPLRRFLVMNLARFLGKRPPHILGALDNMGNQFEHSRRIKVCILRCGCLLARRWCRRLRSTGIDSCRSHQAADRLIAAHGTGQQMFPLLALKILTGGKPALKAMVVFTTKVKYDHVMSD